MNNGFFGFGTPDYVVGVLRSLRQRFVRNGVNNATPVHVIEPGVPEAANVSIALVPQGNGALSLQVPDGAITGGNVRGAGAVDFQVARVASSQVASGLGAFVAGGQSNTASNNYCFVAGSSSTASGAVAVAMGQTATASGNSAIAIGNSNTASAAQAVAIGGSNTASGVGGFAVGSNGTDRGIAAAFSFGVPNRAAAGDRQGRFIPQCVVTANATTTTLTTNAAAEATTNTWVLPNNYSVMAEAMVIARNTANNDTIAWKVTNLLVSRDATAATVAILGTPTVSTFGTADASMTACTLVVNTNTTNGSVRLQFTGLAATNIAVSGFFIPCVENG